MLVILKKFQIFFITVKDIGTIRILLRIIFLFRIKSFRFILPLYWLRRRFLKRKDIKFIDLNFDSGNIKRIKFKKIKSNDFLTFKFLNEEKNLTFPIDWNSNKRTLLWDFNLHYFDMLSGIDFSDFKVAKNLGNIYYLPFLIDDWINKNTPNFGSGWSSYTISLRIRNWNWFFQFIPILKTKKRIDSLWEQFVWLYNNKEKYLGGNHLLENLASLILVSFSFKNNTASKIFHNSLKEIESELNKQILPDGGHEERSASYHIRVLNNLLEICIIFQLNNLSCPIWLKNKILLMNEWLLKIRIYGGNIPRFNDSPVDISSNIDFTLYYVDLFLKGNKLSKEEIFNFLNKSKENIKKINFWLNSLNRSKIIDVYATGWTFFRPNSSIDFIVKSGILCPAYLPPHAHSDILSFELFYKGVPLLSEAGTSSYSGLQRKYERSIKSHNCLQLGIFDKKDSKDNINWLEPLEVWGNFRAGFKPSPILKKYKLISEKEFQFEGAYDAYKKYKVGHKRKIKIYLHNSDYIKIKIIDDIASIKNIAWRLWFHLGPNQDIEILKDLVNNFYCGTNFKSTLTNTTYAKGFGKRITRDTLCLSGKLNFQNIKLISTINIPINKINLVKF